MGDIHIEAAAMFAQQSERKPHAKQGRERDEEMFA